MENHKIILAVFDILFENIKPYLDEIFKSLYGGEYLYIMEYGWKFYQDKKLNEMKDYDLKSEITGPKKYLDLLFYINSIIKNWDSVKSLYVDNYLFILCHDIRYFRNKWAHQSVFTLREVYRVCDLAQSILEIMNINYEQLEHIRKSVLTEYYNQQAENHFKEINFNNNFNTTYSKPDNKEIKTEIKYHFNHIEPLKNTYNNRVNNQNIIVDQEMMEGDDIDRENIHNENYNKIINNNSAGQDYTVSQFGEDDDNY